MRNKLMLLIMGIQVLTMLGCGGGGSSSVSAPGGASTSAPAEAPGATAAATGKSTLSWGAPDGTSDVAGYRVYYSADSSAAPLLGTGADQGPSPVDVSTQTTAVITGLDPSRVYNFAVTAYNSAGVESGYSNIASGRPK
jgi:hypothetical protein